MPELAALGIQPPKIDALGSFARGAATMLDIQNAKRQQAERGLQVVGAVSLGAMGGRLDGEVDPQKYEQGLDLLEQQGIDVAKFRGKPQLAPVAARASMTALQQLQAAQSQKEFDLAMRKFEFQLDQADREMAQGPAPASPLGKLAADLKAGLISQEEYDAAVSKATQSSQGISVTNPDGTTVQIGGPAQGKFDSETAKNDSATIKEARDAAAAAQELRSLATQMETVAPDVGYTGPGGEVYGAIDDVVGIFPGDKGARGAFRQLSMESQLAMTQKTKGAITDREMGMFKKAVPGLTQTPPGNQAMANIMKATAKRLEDRATFFEQYRRLSGTLDGATAAWGKYLKENPLIVDGKDGGVVLSEDVASFDEYLPQSRATPASAGAAPASPASGGDMPEVTSEEEYHALPSGSIFVVRDAATGELKKWRKP